MMKGFDPVGFSSDSSYDESYSEHEKDRNDDDSEDSGQAFYNTLNALTRAGTYLLIGADSSQLESFYRQYCDPCQTSIRLVRSTDDIEIGMTIASEIAASVEQEGTCSVRFSLPLDQIDTPFVNFIVLETQASCFFDVCCSVQEFYNAFHSLEAIDALIIFPSARIDTFSFLPPSALPCVSRMTEKDIVIVPGESNYPCPEFIKPCLLRNALLPEK